MTPGDVVAWSVRTTRGDTAAFHATDPAPERAAVFHEADRRTLVLGSSQRDSTVDVRVARALGVDVAGRRSGGGGVLLFPGEFVWLDLVIPAGDLLWSDDVGRAMVWVGEVWAAALGSLGIDAAVQFASVGGRSIVLVALADLSADRGEAVRLAADLASPAPRALLGSLACDFVLSVAVFHEGPAPVRCFELRSPREDNVARLLARPTTPGPYAVEVATAIARAMAAPPPLDALEHPFQPRRAASSPTDLRAEIRNVARWLEPSRRDRVRLGLGVPEPAVQEVCEAVVRDALRVGIAVWRSSASWVSRNRRAFWMAMTAWLAKVSNSSISRLENGRAGSRPSQMAPMPWPRCSSGANSADAGPRLARAACW